MMASMTSAQTFKADVSTFVEASCMKCHGAETETPLDMTKLGHDLADRETFKAWVRIYDRVKNREMPPRTEPRIKRAVLEKTLVSIKGSLVEANITARGGQRTALRRLTRLEYAYTVSDLLQIDEAIGLELSETLPAEADSGGFNTVAVNQSMSPLHVRGYLTAADRALDAAIQFGPAVKSRVFKRDYIRSGSLGFIANGKQLGLGIVKRLDDAYVAFFDYGSTYTFHSMSEGFQVTTPGRYRVAFEAYPYQAKSTIGLAVYRGRMGGAAASLDELIGAFDLTGDELRTFEMTPFLRPGDLVSPAPFDLIARGNPDPDFNPNNGMDLTNYKGEGIALKSLTIEGPLYGMWPPESTRITLAGVEFTDSGDIRLTKEPYEHVVEVVESFAVRAFRRPLADGELDAYASLAEPLLEGGRPFVEAIRVPLRAILSAPAFLYQTGDSEVLDDHALATRLSYFLWRSMPDAELVNAASEGRLTDPKVLETQVDRMLKDSKSERFVNDFAGQAFRLNELKITNPDPGLYPEYDDRLGHAIETETELFLAELISANHSVGQLIDSNFTFVNRRLAKHYGFPGVKGQQMRKVTLPEKSPRGGLLTQASILKITANGTTTSPIPRGNFVLSNLLGQPAPPPPAGVEALEPDTRGTTTIREQLDAHRNEPVCASCHNTIDPPGFALEAFDPIGGFRENYRIGGGMVKYGDFEMPAPYKRGPKVDASGVTPEGKKFSGIDEYKKLLMDEELEQVARNLASQLLVFSTGAEIEFADRDAVEEIVSRGKEKGYPVRSMIHEVVQSVLFRRQ
ncbi:MAG: DUF1592 domain-containing protein, partial [Candidatus Hydrogenedentota bacterium]